MKSSYAILSLMLVSIIASVAVSASALVNLLQNPGFETNAWDPWETDVWGSGSVGIYPTGHTGTYAAGMGGSEGSGGVVWQDINPPQCATDLEFWYWGTHGYIEINYTDGTDYSQGLDDTSAWTLVHIDLDTNKLVEGVLVSAGGLGGMDVDDFDLEACSVPSIPEFGLALPLLISMALVPLLVLYHRKNLTLK